MKKLYFFLLMGLAISSADAQTTSRNWTKTDCAGQNHNLFAELDSGNVVILEYIMLNCQSCVTAANGLKSIVAPYATSHPGRVRLYSIGYINSYTCSQMNAWKTTHNFNHPVFTEGAADVSYYGGMGMPTIVITGNSSHSVYYKKLGYAASDNAAITAAINQALAVSNPTGIAGDDSDTKVQLYPNPARNLLNLAFEPGSVEQVRITDLTGRLILKQQVNKAAADAQINTSGLPAGLYLLHYLKDNKVVANRKFVKTETN